MTIACRLPVPKIGFYRACVTVFGENGKSHFGHVNEMKKYIFRIELVILEVPFDLHKVNADLIKTLVGEDAFRFKRIRGERASRRHRHRSRL